VTEVNPQNYPGARVFVVGTAGGEPRDTTFGTRELSIAVGEGYKKDGQWVDTGTTWYTLSATLSYAEDNWPYVGKGDKVRVDDAKQETRQYEKDGETRTQIKLSYGRLSVLQSKSAPDDDKPF
jgi:single-stranded DNA-binding protein